MSYLTQLLEFVAPPEKPDVMDYSWESVEHEWEISFPLDFKAIIQKYGVGGFDPARVSLISPTYWYPKGFEFPGKLELLDSELGNCDEIHNLNAFQNGSGLFPFAYIPSGNRLLWDVSPSTEDWPIVLLEDYGYGGLVRVSEGEMSTAEAILRCFKFDENISEFEFANVFSNSFSLNDCYPQTFWTRSSNRQEALFECVHKGGVSRLKDVFAWKVDVNSTDSENQTPIGYAVRNNNEEMVRALLSYGAVSDDPMVIEYIANLDEPGE